MRIVFIYSQHDNRQLQVIDRVKEEMSAFVDEVAVMELDEAKQLYHISRTPAVIIIREDLQGENLMGEGVDGKLLMSAMVVKQTEEEELVFHNAQHNRMDNYIKARKNEAIDEILDDMLDRGVL